MCFKVGCCTADHIFWDKFFSSLFFWTCHVICVIYIRSSLNTSELLQKQFRSDSHKKNQIWRNCINAGNTGRAVLGPSSHPVDCRGGLGQLNFSPYNLYCYFKLHGSDRYLSFEIFCSSWNSNRRDGHFLTKKLLFTFGDSQVFALNKNSLTWHCHKISTSK